MNDHQKRVVWKKSTDTKDGDERRTPKWLFRRYDRIYHFQLDAAATKENRLCRRYFSKENSALVANRWLDSPGTVWCNPPYSISEKFVKKAYDQWSHHRIVTVLLLPARTDRVFFHEYVWDRQRHRPYEWISHLNFWKGRLYFSNEEHGAPFPSMIVTMGHTKAFYEAQDVARLSLALAKIQL